MRVLDADTVDSYLRDIITSADELCTLMGQSHRTLAIKEQGNLYCHTAREVEQIRQHLGEMVEDIDYPTYCE